MRPRRHQIRLSVSNSTFSNSAVGEGFTVSTRSNGNFQLVATGSTFSGNFSTGIHVDAGDSSRNDVSVTRSTSSGNYTGVTVSGSGTSNTTFNVSNNSNITTTAGSGVALAANGASTMSGNVLNNTITSTVTNNPSFGIDAVVDGTGSMTAKIDGNAVTVFFDSFDGGARGGVGAHADLTVTNNTFDTTGNTAPYSPMVLFSGNGTPGESATVCFNVSGNTLHTGGTNYDVEIDQYTGDTFNLQGYTGAGSDANAVKTFLAGQNTGISSVVDGTGSMNVTNATCALP